MKIHFIQSVGILLVIALVAACDRKSQNELAGDNELANQVEISITNQAEINEKERRKQGNKLYPYFFDYPVDLTIDGEVLLPILRSLDSFRKDPDIPETKKDLSKYKIELKQDEDHFFVLLTVKRDPQKHYVGGETEDGIDVTYFVSKADGRIKRVFHK